MTGPCPSFDLLRHVLVTGGTGCGKTVSVVLPLLARSLAQDAANPALKPAIVVVDVKGDLTLPLRQLALRHGRADDIVEISTDSAQVTDLFVDIGRDPYAGSQLIAGANWARVGAAHLGGDNAYWEAGAQSYIASAIAWLRLLEQPCTPEHLLELVSATGASKWQFADGRSLAVHTAVEMTQKLSPSPEVETRRLAVVLRRLTELLTQADPRTRAIFTSILTQIIEPLAHPLSHLIATSPATWTPESWLREGRILLLRLPFVTEPGPSNYAARFIKLSLQRLILSRHRAALRDCVRPCFLFFDEAHRFITGDLDTGDQYFVDRCRSMKAGCVFATQSVSALQPLLDGSQLDTFLANINSRVFGRTLDRPTAELAANLLCDVDWIEDYRGTQFLLSPDPDPDVPPQPTFPPHSTGNRQLTPADLAQLESGEFYVIEGGKSYRWEAALDEAFRTPEFTAPSRPPAIPAWSQLPALAEFADKLKPPPPPAPTGAPAPSQPAPPAKRRYTRPGWLRQADDSSAT